MEEQNRPAESAQPIELRIQYKRLNSFFADYAKNIHRGRTFIATDRLLAIGTDFVFKLEVPGVPEALVLSGKVQWLVTPDQPGQVSGMGIGFVYESDADRERIESTVATLMSASLGQPLYEKLVRKPAVPAAPDGDPPTPVR